MECFDTVCVQECSEGMQGRRGRRMRNMVGEFKVIMTKKTKKGEGKR